MDEGGVFEEFAVLDLFRDLGEVLIDDAARAHVEVADFGVAHLTVGQADGAAARAERRGGVLLLKSVGR